ncbi:MFS transporter [Solimonas terrae]|uniref:MFS transporter n=1 Tax=Solimonas terrae TaxID=1396819 RepID=A0A6M2BTB5_9GAMM|nr:MFS transporter [Solimonas terrae]
MQAAAVTTSKTPVGSTGAVRAALRSSRLGSGTKLSYAVGAAVEGTISALVNTFLLFYATTVCGLSASLAGVAIAAGLVVDAIADPLIGSLSDNLHSRLGRRLPFMLVGLPMIAASFVAIFSLPDWNQQGALFVLLAFLSIAVRIGVSTFHLPFLTVGAEIVDDHVERSRIMSFCWGFAMIGALSGVVIGFSFFFSGPAGLADRQAYAPFALTLAAIVVIWGSLSCRTVHRTLARQHLPPATPAPLLRRLMPELRELFGNRSFRLLFASSLIFFVAFGMTQALALHANSFFWHLRSGQIQLVTVAFIVGTLVGAPLMAPLIGRLEKKTSVLVGLGGWAAMQALPSSLRLLGALPLEGQALAVFLAAAMSVAGSLMAMAAIAFISMMADAADEHEYLFGARREGLFYAGWAFAGKTAGSIGSLLSGLLLTAIHFPVQETRQAGLDIVLPDAMVRELGFFYGPGAAALSFVGAVFLIRYRLDRATHARMVEELRQRRHDDAAPHLADQIRGSAPASAAFRRGHDEP